jgi:hypothetical protein
MLRHDRRDLGQPVDPEPAGEEGEPPPARVSSGRPHGHVVILHVEELEQLSTRRAGPGPVREDGGDEVETIDSGHPMSILRLAALHKGKP